MPQSQPDSRIPGYDIARAFAVFAMVLVNYKIALGASKNGPEFLVILTEFFEGRASATFVVLAGVGISLLSKKAREAGELDKLLQHRRVLWNRSLFLFVVGLLYTPFWTADILHFYGLYIAVGALCLTLSDRKLWGLAGLFSAAFVMMLFVLDYEKGWDFAALEYLDLWTAQGMVRHLFFNGFHPLFPWGAFLLVGMWLGRKDLVDSRRRRKYFFVALAIALIAELSSYTFLQGALSKIKPEEREVVIALFGTDAMPPMPQYLLAAGATAIAVICLSLELVHLYPKAFWIGPLVSTGQMALSLYVAHVVVGMGTLYLLDLFENQTLVASIGYTAFFCIISLFFSHWWKQKFSQGPLEWCMRRVTG